MNVEKRAQLEELTKWLSTCPIKNEPIVYMKSSYQELQILQEDFEDCFIDYKVADRYEIPSYEFSATLNGIKVFCITDQEASNDT